MNEIKHLIRQFGTELFDEVSYEKNIAEAFLNSPHFQEKEAIPKLQALLRLFSLISEYNSVYIFVRQFYATNNLHTHLTDLLDQHCPEENPVTITTATAQDSEQVKETLIKFFNDWFFWMDSFPKEDYEFFLHEYLLPTCYQCIDLDQITTITHAQKQCRSIQHLLVFSTQHWHFSLHFECDIY